MGKKCKVRGCPETHSTHYCRLCEEDDTTHFSRDCPTGRILYHGTRLSNIQGVAKAGLKASTDGRLGAGVYFTESFEVASSISNYRGSGSGAAVFSNLCSLFFHFTYHFLCFRVWSFLEYILHLFGTSLPNWWLSHHFSSSSHILLAFWLSRYTFFL